MLPRFLLVVALLTTGAGAAVIGTNPPAQPLTLERIARLPAAEQPAWRSYLVRSQALRAADQKSLADERKTAAPGEAPTPTTARHGGARLLNRDPAWYGTADAQRMADNVVSFQTPAGGWSKNFDPSEHPRQPGEGYSHDNNSHFLANGDNDAPADPHWSYIGTFDNNATTTELRFLARVAAATDAKTGAKWRAAFRRGLGYIYTAQYPNGGWPQVFPLEGGYHDAITFNDNAYINVIDLLRDAADGEAEFGWLDAEDRRRAAESEARGLACLLAAQVRVHGQLTAWCQQFDELTLAPTSARNYEMPALSASETSDVVLYLMSLPKPTPAVVAAVHAAAKWLDETALHDVAFRPAPDKSGRTLVAAPGEGPIWARYVEIGTNRPLFGDRDKTIHDRVDEISKERRNGYSWFGSNPHRVLEHYQKWAKAHPAEAAH